MPKSRANKQVSFQVWPWQSKQSLKENVGEDVTTVQYFSPTSMTKEVQNNKDTQKNDSRLPLDPGSDTTPWVTRSAFKSDSAGGRHEEENVSYSSSSELENCSADETVNQLSSCRGACQLALLPSGHISGHFVDASTNIAFGIMGRCVSRSMGRSACMEEEDSDVVKLELINFQTNKKGEAVVSKTGGDMAHLSPADSWQLRKYLGIQDADKAMEMLEVQVNFLAEQLFEGEEAERQLKKFSPKLLGLGAIINVGVIDVRGAPSHLLSNKHNFITELDL